ncbi:hypothetical protein FACS1894122_06410 [Alphaproteobacteria bacterium]|nr:hypothetical protein FACS1894122_06410 [Alphaproteobacteria bacterium]
MTMKISSKVLVLVLACMGVMNAAAMDNFPRLQMSEDQANQRAVDMQPVVCTGLTVFFPKNDIGKVSDFVTTKKLRTELPANNPIVPYLVAMYGLNDNPSAARFNALTIFGLLDRNIPFDVELTDDETMVEFCLLQKRKIAVFCALSRYGSADHILLSLPFLTADEHAVEVICGALCKKVSDGPSKYTGRFAFGM